MKKLRILLLVALSTMLLLLTGCLSLQLGGGSTRKAESPTLGQQLIDLQRAKDAGAINESQYRLQKAKLLQGK